MGSDPGVRPQTDSADDEAGQSLRGFFRHVHRLDLGAAWAPAAELDQALDAFRLTLEHGLHRSVPPVCDPAAEPVLLRQPAHGVAEEHALHVPVDDEAAADHAAYSRPVELRKILERRRMVRAYEPGPIDRATIERIVGTVRRAPSAGFSQGQRLLVVTDADKRRALAELLDSRGWVDAAPLL